MRLHFKKLGTGFPLIILHGLYGSSDNWVTIGRKLSEVFSVYLIDQRNHGKSPHSDVHNYDALSDDLHEFFNFHSISTAHIIGHSMGGKASLFFAKKYPEKIKKLIIVDISPFTYTNSDYRKQNLLIHQEIIYGLSGIDLKKFKTRNEVDSALSDSIKSKFIRQFLLKNLSRDKNNNFSWKLNINVINKQLDEIFNGISIDEQLKLSIPTLFLKGKNSDYINTDDISLMHKAFSDYTIIEIENTGHLIHFEQPDIFLKQVTDFLL